MKSQSKFLLSVFLFAMLPFSALASQTQKKDITLSEQTQVAGTQLQPGDYQLKWDKNATGTTNVTFYREGKVVATAPAQVIQQKNSGADFELNTANGENRIEHVYTSRERLDFGGSAPPTTGD